jgi:hypothetical protein
MTILKNKNYNVFLIEVLSLLLILIVSLIPWFEFINSNHKEINEIFNDSFNLLIYLYLLIVILIYFVTKFLFKDKTKIFHISLVGISIWFFFQFNLIKSFLNRIFTETFLWHFSSEISLFLVIFFIIFSFYYLNKENNFSFFIIFFLLFNFLFLSFNLFPKLKSFYVENKIKFESKTTEVNSTNQIRPNIYYFLIDAMKPLNEFEEFYKIELNDFRNFYQSFDYKYYENTSNLYIWTTPVMTSFFFLEENIFTPETQNLNNDEKKLKSHIYQTFPTFLKKEYQTKLLKELNQLGFRFKWVGNYSQNCSQTNFKYCLSDKKENLIDLYTLQAFLNKSPLVQIFDNLIQIEFIQNNFNLNILHSNTFWEIDKYISSNKDYIENMEPTFFFIHDMETHEPYFVDSNCNSKRFPGIYNLEGYKNSYLCVIKRMSKMIKTIDEFDPDSIVIFHSDHSWIMSTESEIKYGKRNNIFSLIKNNKICKKQIPSNPNNLNSIKYFVNCLKSQKN